MSITLPVLLACLARQGAPTHPDLADLTERWQRAMTDFGVAGMAMVLVEGDEVVHQVTLGERDPERHLPVTADTLFYLASATKPFVALALAKLAEEGKVDLDAPVRRYLPRFALADEQASASITVRDLLCHRPGLDSFPIVLLDAYTGEITEERFYHFLAEVKPGGGVAYSNLHFTLAGRVIEAVTGQSWRDYLAEHVFAPAGMTRSTGYATWMYAQADVALPCLPTAQGFAPASVRKSDNTMHAAGGLGCSIHDLGVWLRLNLGRGSLGELEVAGPAAVEEMFRLQAPASSESGLARSRASAWAGCRARTAGTCCSSTGAATSARPRASPSCRSSAWGWRWWRTPTAAARTCAGSSRSTSTSACWRTTRCGIRTPISPCGRRVPPEARPTPRWRSSLRPRSLRGPASAPACTGTSTSARS